MEVKQLEVIKKWPELKSVENIQVFLGFPISIGNSSKVSAK